MSPKTEILIVDDKVENLITLENLLDSFDVELVRATSGEEALGHLLDDHDFALVLLDVQMPGMNGYEVAELMRGNKLTRNIPIIFVTAESSMDAHIFRGYESGAVDYLLKPLNEAIFKSKVNVFIELHEQKVALSVKTREFDKQLAELEELQQQLEETNEQLLMLSTTDGLTGLINKRRYEELYKEEWERASRTDTSLSLIILDIDHFKMYNDTYGHHIGDDCLRDVANALSAMELRKLDRVARIGGEEFAIILPDTDQQGVEMVAERAREAIEELQIEHNPDSGRPWVTASVGCSTIEPSKELKPIYLTQAADDALYDSKRNNRNRVTFKAVEVEMA